ncbi:MAG: type II toxin-antitoxin system prevent-host-death family antitoxin [Chloroflexota bacterium]
MEIGVRELKAKLSDYLARVERGETVDVLRHGRRVARIVPAVGETTVERGLREGWLHRADPRPPEPFSPLKPAPGAPTSEQVLDEIRAERI